MVQWEVVADLGLSPDHGPIEQSFVLLDQDIHTSIRDMIGVVEQNFVVSIGAAEFAVAEGAFRIEKPACIKALALTRVESPTT